MLQILGMERASITILVALRDDQKVLLWVGT